MIHLEQQWKDNFFTAAGEALHEKVHSGIAESRKIVRIERNLKIASNLLGVVGQTDAVEFYSDGRVIPIEYKHGSMKSGTEDEVQLCAQAICLEEMLKIKIDIGIIFYFKTKRRVQVPLTEDIRKETVHLAKKFHNLIDSGVTPPAIYTHKCESCSLVDNCYPETAGRSKSVDSYIMSWLERDYIIRED